MPKSKTKFQEKWLTEIDSEGHQYSLWCRKGKDDYHGYCFLCKKDISIDNSGLPQLRQHSGAQGHKTLAKSVLSATQTKLTGIKKPESSQASTSQLGLCNLGDEITTAEIIWAGKVAVSNFSFRSTDGIVDTFKAMFKCPIADGMTLSRTKISYLLADGLGPVYREEMIKDLKESDHFTLHYDETTQAQVKKQMDIYIRYWSTTHNEVWCRFYKALFFGHAEGVKVANSIFSALKEDKIGMDKLVTLGSDGPNVNKTIWRELQSKIRAAEPSFRSFVDVGTCNIHVMHNGFSKGLEKYGHEIEQLIIDLLSLFKYSAGRREDYKHLQLNLDLEIQMFMQYSSVRWLSLGPCVSRVLSQWTGIVEYMDHLQKGKDVQVPKSAAFKRLMVLLGSASSRNVTLVQLYFIENVFQLFEEFLKSFQSDEPQIHRLYDEIGNLMIKLLLRLVKKELVQNKHVAELPDIDVSKSSNQVPDSELSIGESTRKHLKKLPDVEQKKCILGMRSNMSTIASYLQKKLPFSSKLLASLGCLNPQKIIKSSPANIELIARELSTSDEIVTRVTDEWKVLSMDQSLQTISYSRVDHFWREIFGQQTSDHSIKYPALTSVIKIAMVLPHGNADVERGLSINNTIVTKEGNQLSETSINGLRVTKDAVKFCDPENMKPEKLLITKQVLTAARKAHREYQHRLDLEREEQERQKREIEEKRAEDERRKREREKLVEEKSSLAEKQKKLDEEERSVKQSLNAAYQLLKEGNDKMKESIKAGDMTKISSAQMMIDTATNKTGEYNKSLEDIRSKQKDLERKKRKLLESSLDLTKSSKDQPPQKKKK